LRRFSRADILTAASLQLASGSLWLTSQRTVFHLKSQNEVGGGHSRAILFVAKAAPKGWGFATLEIATRFPLSNSRNVDAAPPHFPPETHHQLPAPLPAHTQQLCRADTLYFSNSSLIPRLTGVCESGLLMFLTVECRPHSAQVHYCRQSIGGCLSDLLPQHICLSPCCCYRLLPR
jgi:hypothetical protein